jgi:predicted phosphodiesterase
MHAIISDLHSNLDALNAVMADIEAHGVSEVLCLGDVVGYGADPEACIDLVEEKCRFCLSGNHDYAVLTEAERFNPPAAEAIDFTRRVLKPNSLSLGRKKARWRFLELLPTRIVEGDILYVHGSPRDDRNEYILESDIVFGNLDKVREILDMVPRLLFVGHTHVPCVIDQDCRFWRADGDEAEYRFAPGAKYLVNIGSVGQPRDGNNKACYVLVEGDTVTWRRVAYDFHRTMEKMVRVGPLSLESADRLEYGR